MEIRIYNIENNDDNHTKYNILRILQFVFSVINIALACCILFMVANRWTLKLLPLNITILVVPSIFALFTLIDIFLQYCFRPLVWSIWTIIAGLAAILYMCASACLLIKIVVKVNPLIYSALASFILTTILFMFDICFIINLLCKSSSSISPVHHSETPASNKASTPVELLQVNYVNKEENSDAGEGYADPTGFSKAFISGRPRAVIPSSYGGTFHMSRDLAPLSTTDTSTDPLMVNAKNVLGQFSDSLEQLTNISENETSHKMLIKKPQNVYTVYTEHNMDNTQNPAYFDYDSTKGTKKQKPPMRPLSKFTYNFKPIKVHDACTQARPRMENASTSRDKYLGGVDRPTQTDQDILSTQRLDCKETLIPNDTINNNNLTCKSIQCTPPGIKPVMEHHYYQRPCGCGQMHYVTCTVVRDSTPITDTNVGQEYSYSTSNIEDMNTKQPQPISDAAGDFTVEKETMLVPPSNTVTVFNKPEFSSPFPIYQSTIFPRGTEPVPVMCTCDIQKRSGHCPKHCKKYYMYNNN